jgi:hypothetical protein
MLPPRISAISDGPVGQRRSHRQQRRAEHPVAGERPRRVAVARDVVDRDRVDRRREVVEHEHDDRGELEQRPARAEEAKAPEQDRGDEDQHHRGRHLDRDVQPPAAERGVELWPDDREQRQR